MAPAGAFGWGRKGTEGADASEVSERLREASVAISRLKEEAYEHVVLSRQERRREVYKPKKVEVEHRRPHWQRHRLEQQGLLRIDLRSAHGVREVDGEGDLRPSDILEL